MGFSDTEYEKFNDTISESPLQLTFKKLLRVDFWFSIFDEEYPKLPNKTIKILLPFPTMYLCEACFSSYTSTRAIYCNRLNADADIKIQLISIKAGINEICKNAKQWPH